MGGAGRDPAPLGRSGFGELGKAVDRGVVRGSLRRLEALRLEIQAGPETAGLLRDLTRRRLPNAEALLQFHELGLWFLAYPSSTAVHQAARRALDHFARRPELARHQEALADTGVAGTPIHYRFYWPLARWLAETWPERLHLDWEAGLDDTALLRWLPRLVSPAERATVAADPRAPRALLLALAKPHTDASFLIEALARASTDPRLVEWLHDDFDHPYRLEPAAARPARTLGRWPVKQVVLRHRPWSKVRPNLEAELAQPSAPPKALPPAQAWALITLAKEAMVTRSRDLEVFGFGNPKDTAWIQDQEGLAFGAIGFLPEKRLPYQGTYGLVTLQNGVPIGYVQLDGLLGHVEVSFNTFETFRGGESARIFARTLAAARALFGAKSFSIEPYQLGDHNEEAIESGAWWFYQKLGFRPADRRTSALMQKELAKMRAHPEHRSSPRTLRTLAQRHLYFSLDPKAAPLPMRFDRLSTRASAWLIAHGGPRAEAEAEAVAQLRRLTQDTRSLRPLELEVFRRFAPLLLSVPDFARWSPAERAQIPTILRAKAGGRERDYVRAFDAHPKLGRAFCALLHQPGPA